MNPKALGRGGRLNLLKEVRKFIKGVKREGIKPSIITAIIIICLITTFAGYLQGASYPWLLLGSIIFLVVLTIILMMSAKIDQRRKTW